MEVEFIKPKVYISSLPQDPENPDWGATEETVYSTRISHDKEGRSPKEIWKDEKSKMSPEELRKSNRDFLNKIAKWGHISAFYQASVGLLYEIPRHSTMYLCSFDFSKYLQQSQRYTKGKYFIVERDEFKEMIPKSFDLYNRMVEDGIEKEDARYILSLSTAATQLHQNTDFTALANIHRVIESKYSKVPSLTKRIVGQAINGLNSKEPDLFRKDLIDLYNSNEKGYPVANMFSEPNKWVNEVIQDDKRVTKFARNIDEELVSEAKNLNDQALSFLNMTHKRDEVEGYITNMSLSAWHQFMRNDTVKNSTESIYDAVKRRKIVVPPKIQESKYEEEFTSLSMEMLDFYESMKPKFGETDSIEVIPHNLSLGIAFDFDNYNALVGFMRDRTSKAAQWEIRQIAKDVKDMIGEENPVYSKFIG